MIGKYIRRCPEARTQEEGPDCCLLNGKVCILEGGHSCPYLENYLIELAEAIDG